MVKPMNSFFLFCDANRSKVQKSNPDKSNADITSLLGHYWRTMAANEKKKYKDLASAKRKEYAKLNPIPKRKKKEIDGFTFTFRISSPKNSSKKIAEKSVEEKPKIVPIKSFIHQHPVVHNAVKVPIENQTLPTQIDLELETLQALDYFGNINLFCNDYNHSSYISESIYSTFPSEFAPVYSSSLFDKY